MAKVLLNKQNFVDVPTLILQNRNFDNIDKIKKFNEFTYKDNFNSANEISLNIPKYINGKRNDIWDSIVDFKIITIPEFQERFEIGVGYTDESSVTKSITGISLCEAELSVKKIFSTIEINTETDILNPLYDANFPTVFYRKPEDFASYDWSDDKYLNYTDSQKKNILIHSSLLHRILESVPSYSIGYVDESLWNLQREFSISNIDIYSELTGEIATEFHCLFLFDSMTRTINVYDLYNTCRSCGYRGDFSDKCPKCNSTDFYGQYGEDTSVFISRNNLSTQITLESNKDALINCFYVEGGDDNINAAIRTCNPTGTQYFYYFSDDIKKDMPPELVEKIESYNTKYDRCIKEESFTLNSSIVTDYNSVVNDINSRFADDNKVKYTTLSNPIIGYKATTLGVYNAIDLYSFVKTSMMPTIVIDGLGLSDSLNNIVNSFKTGFSSYSNEIAVDNHTTLVQSTLERTILKTAKLFYRSANYDLKISTDSYIKATSIATKGTWKGTFILTSLSEIDEITGEKKSVESEIVTLYISNNKELFLEQSIYRAISDIDKLKENDITSLKIDETTFKSRIRLYSLDELNNLHDCFTNCLGVIVSAEITDNTIKNKFYNFYNTRIGYIDLEISDRNIQLEKIKKVYYYDSESFITSGILYDLRNKINNELNFEKYIGEDFWKLFCTYSREDSYSNSNYISDGLSNTEIISNAYKLIEVAKKELYKTGNLQYSITTTMNNLLALKEFATFAYHFNVGNWIRIGTDEKVFKLRLLSYQINFDEIQDITVEFSTVEKIQDGSSDIKSVIDSVKSISTSYNSVVSQVEKNKPTNMMVSKWVNDGLNATKIKYVNANNQNLVINQNGLLARMYDDIKEVYSPYQLKIINNGLYTTHDNWNTIDTGIGRISYTDPNTGDIIDDYGIIAKTVIGKLFLGENLGIYTPNGNFKLDENGLNVNDRFKVDMNGDVTLPDNASISWKQVTGTGNIATKDFVTGQGYQTSSQVTEITKNTVTTSFVNALEVIAGSVAAEDITGTTILGKTILGGNINIGNGNFYVDSSGNIITKGTMSLGDGKLIYNSNILTVSGIINATGGTFSGNITSTGIIKGGAISGAKISGGTINIGSGFSVSSTGILTSTGANITGNINAINLKAKSAYYIYDLDFENDIIKVISNLPDGTSDTKINFGRLTKNDYSNSLNYIAFKDISQDRECHVYSGSFEAHCPVFATKLCTGNIAIYNNTIKNEQDKTLSLVCSDGFGLYMDNNNLCIRPFEAYDGTTKLGTANQKFGQIYSSNSQISTSDRNEKDNIKILEDKHLKFFLLLQPVSFLFKKGTSGRTHIGFISQDVEDAMFKCGLTDLDFAGFCKDIKTNIYTDEQGKGTEITTLDSNGEVQYIYSLRYEEFIPLVTFAVQKLFTIVEDLKNEINRN